MATEDDQLDALVGAALRGLVNSGASSKAIGEFANKYRREASEILGLVEAKSLEPDLLALVATAVKQALAEANAGGSQRKATRRRRFYVRVSGERTSVTIPMETAEKLFAEKGERQARKFVANLAENAPKTVPNRSRWVEERINATIAFSSQDAPEARH